ncbi:MAG: nuclear transport factor 2 family protein [Gemmatimonadota bacterium]
MRLFSRSAVALLALVGLTLPMAAHAQIAPDRIPLQTKLNELMHLREAYNDALNTKDVAKLAGMYAEDAILITPDGVMHKGYAAIAKHLADNVPTFPHAVITSDSLSVYGNMAIDVGTVALHPANAASTSQRYMTVSQRGLQGVWKIQRVALVPVGS